MSRPTARLPRALPAALLAVALAMPVACGGSPTPTPTAPGSPAATGMVASPRPGPSSTSAAAAPDPCSLLGATAAATALGEPVGPAQRILAAEGTACLYATRADDLGAVSLTVASTAEGSGALERVADEAPDASASPSLGQGVLTAPGAAWLIRDGRLLTIVMLAPGGDPGAAAAVAALVRTVQGPR